MASYFSDIQQIRVRPGFDDQCAVTLENFSSIIGEYQLADDVYCQLFRDDRICQQEHRHGWLARTKDGKEGLIGSTCAPKHFKASRTFALERNRVRRELRIQSFIDRLTQVLADPDYRRRLETAIGRLRALDHEIEDLRTTIPLQIMDRLTDMGRGRARPDLGVEYRYEEKGDDGQVEVTYVEQTVATVAGVEIWNSESLRAVAEELHSMRRALDDAKPDSNVGERQLAQWVGLLDRLPGHEASIARFQESLDRFNAAANLRLLWLLTRRPDEQREAVKLALLEETGNPVGDDQANRELNEMRNALRQANAGRDFRPL